MLEEFFRCPTTQSAQAQLNTNDEIVNFQVNIYIFIDLCINAILFFLCESKAYKSKVKVRSKICARLYLYKVVKTFLNT